MKTGAKVLAGLILSALTLYSFFKGIDLEEVAASLAGPSLLLLLVSILIGYFGHLPLRSWRWAAMLGAVKEQVCFHNLFSTTAIGYAISWLTPGRIGEVARPVLLARREGIPAAARALASKAETTRDP